MKRFLIAVAVVVFVATSIGDGATLAGVNLPDTIQAGNATLTLNGMGLRKKFVIKVYVAGLYLPQKTSNAQAIITAESPKRIVMKFLHDVSKKQLTDAFDDSFNDNAPEIKKTAKADVDRFLGALEGVKDGDQIVFTYVPGTGTTFAINAQEKLTIASPAFARALWAVWLGPKPPNADLKKGMLGL